MSNKMDRSRAHEHAPHDELSSTTTTAAKQDALSRAGELAGSRIASDTPPQEQEMRIKAEARHVLTTLQQGKEFWQRVLAPPSRKDLEDTENLLSQFLEAEGSAWRRQGEILRSEGESLKDSARDLPKNLELGFQLLGRVLSKEAQSWKQAAQEAPQFLSEEFMAGLHLVKGTLAPLNPFGMVPVERDEER